MSRILPILFNTDMVRAILDGRKTLTRRKINVDVANSFDIDTDGSVYGCQNKDGDFVDAEKMCTYQPGDILYVRETWTRVSCSICDMDAVYCINCTFPEFEYKADHDESRLKELKDCGYKWHPSIHMPKAAARIWLKVTDVRVERLRDMSEEQVKAEGVYFSSELMGWTWKNKANRRTCHAYIGMYSAMKALWNSTVKEKDKDKYGWNASPWVDSVPTGSSFAKG